MVLYVQIGALAAEPLVLHAEVLVLHAEILLLHAEVPLLHLDTANGYLFILQEKELYFKTGRIAAVAKQGRAVAKQGHVGAKHLQQKLNFPPVHPLSLFTEYLVPEL